jgi:hypothetical protein
MNVALLLAALSATPTLDQPVAFEWRADVELEFEEDYLFDDEDEVLV